MKHVVGATMMLMSISGAFTLDQNRFLWSGDQSSGVTEEAQVVEVVRWRQPVCVLPAEGVSPCVHGLRKFQAEYKKLSNKGLDLENGEQRRLAKFKLSGDKEDFSGKLVSPEIVASVPLVNLQSSEASPGAIAEFIVQESLDVHVKTPELTEEQEKNVRGGKHLAAKDVAKPQQIYVTKVLDTPVTATLVAHNCLPDIGVPLCDYQANVQPSKPVFHSKPSLSISVEKPVAEQGSLGCLWEALFPSNSQQSVCGGLNKPLVEAAVPPLVDPRPEVIISKPGSHGPVASVTYGGSTEPTKFQHIVTSWGTSHIVTDVGHEPGDVSSFSTSKFNFLEKPTEEMTPDQSIKPEIAIELDATDVVTEASEVSESSEPPRQNSSSQVHWNKHPIVQAIHDLVNKTKKSAMVQTLQDYLHMRHEVQDSGSSTNSSSILESLSGPGSVFHHKKDKTTTSKPRVSGATVEDTSSRGVLIEQPSLVVEETPTVMNILRKPETILRGHLDCWTSSGGCRGINREPLTKPTEKGCLVNCSRILKPMEFENLKNNRG